VLVVLLLAIIPVSHLQDGSGPLHFAANSGQKEIVGLLLDRGCDSGEADKVSVSSVPSIYHDPRYDRLTLTAKRESITTQT
jgi:ankyrin repeat protein